MSNSYPTKLMALAQELEMTSTGGLQLLQEALTHRSAVNELGLRQLDSNERLEFLGDAVLELIVSDYLVKRFPTHHEGELTRLRAAIVCEPSLAARARAMGFGGIIRLGKGEATSGGAERAPLLADSFEALVGAVFQEHGYQRAVTFVEQHLLKNFPFDRTESFMHEAKSLLQEWIQAHSQQSISYNLVAEQGPDHDKNFTVAVVIGDRELGRATAKSKKQAEQMAASQALQSLRSGE